MKFQLLLCGNVSTLAWTCEFDEPSKEMAIDFASRALKCDPCARGAHQAILFSEDAVIASWKIATNTQLHLILGE